MWIWVTLPYSAPTETLQPLTFVYDRSYVLAYDVSMNLGTIRVIVTLSADGDYDVNCILLLRRSLITPCTASC